MSLIERLRADLTAAAFTVSGLESLWGADAGSALRRGHRAPAVRALREPAATPPIAVLARLFVLGLPVTADELAAALLALGTDGAVELGLVASDPADGIRPLVDLRPYAFTDSLGDGSWWIASDLGELALGGPLPEDHVLGVGGASTTLAGLAFQTRVASVLDLGTGCGIQAMHQSRFADRVVATDISERALRFARLNIGLNGIGNVELRLGSLYQPVAGERFERIVSNPPFVITPRRAGVPAYEYRDGGFVGDGLVEAVLREAPAHLMPGGTAQLLGNWEYRADADGLERAAGWLAGAGLEHWLIEREQLSPAEYAETWIRDGGTRPGPEFDRLSTAWIDDFAERGVTAVGFGYVLARRPAASAVLRRAERLHGALGGSGGALGLHLEACVAALDAIAGLDDTEIARVRFAVAGDVTEERDFWPGDDQPSAMLLKQGGGFARAISADTGLIAFVGACDGELPAGAIAAALAQLLEVDESALTVELLAAARELVASGMLRPVD